MSTEERRQPRLSQRVMTPRLHTDPGRQEPPAFPGRPRLARGCTLNMGVRDGSRPQASSAVHQGSRQFKMTTTEELSLMCASASTRFSQSKRPQGRGGEELVPLRTTFHIPPARHPAGGAAFAPQCRLLVTNTNVFSALPATWTSGGGADGRALRPSEGPGPPRPAA